VLLPLSEQSYRHAPLITPADRIVVAPGELTDLNVATALHVATNTGYQGSIGWDSSKVDGCRCLDPARLI
jgi:hypothetical protein